MKVRLTTIFGDTFTIEDPDCVMGAFGYHLRGPYQHEGRDYICGLFFLDAVQRFEVLT